MLSFQAAPLPYDSVLTFVVDNALDGSLLVSERQRHQTKSTAKAVRQRGRAATAMADRTAEPTLRETLMKRLAAAVPASDTLNKTTGIDRFVRHTGTFSGPELPGASTKRAENKATVQAVAASVSFSFTLFISFHPTDMGIYTEICPASGNRTIKLSIPA
jgi:hypothetical protein